MHRISEGWPAVLLLLALGVATARAAGPPSLPAEDASRLERGETVAQERAVSGWPWPEIVVYRRSTAAPTAIMAVYTDFEAQPAYVPGLAASRVVGRDAQDVTRVFYEYDVAGPNEQHLVVTTVSRTGAEWHLRWTLVRGRYARRGEGALHVVPSGQGSLIITSSLVDPGKLGSSFGTPATVATRLMRTAEALAARTEQMAATAPGRLEALIGTLRSAPPPREEAAP